MGSKAITINDVRGGIGMVGQNVWMTMDGLKTQTRRTINVEWSGRGRNRAFRVGNNGKWIDSDARMFPVRVMKFAKYQPGRVYYVKEALQRFKSGGESVAIYKSNGRSVREGAAARRWERDDGTPWKPKVIPAMLMPKSAARTFIEITDVKCERLHDITIEGIVAEGVTVAGVKEDQREGKLRQAWKYLWDQCNGRGSWERNEWVFAYSFKTVKINKTDNL